MDLTTSIIVFDVLCSLAGGCSIIFILIAYFSKKVSRLPTWYLIMFTGALYSLSMLMLVGYQITNREPLYEWCLVQATLVYSLPVGLTSAGAMFAIQLHLTLKYFVLNQKTRLHRSSMLLVFIPMVLMCAMIVLVVVLGISHPEEVGRSESQMYCRLEDDIASRAAGILSGISGLALLITQGFTVALLWPRWRSSAATELSQKSGGLVSRSTVIRLVVLDVMALSALIIGGIQGAVRQSSAIMNLYIAGLTLVGLVAFGISTIPFRQTTKVAPSDVESVSEKAWSPPSSRAGTPLPTFPMTTQ